MRHPTEAGLQISNSLQALTKGKNGGGVAVINTTDIFLSTHLARHGSRLWGNRQEQDQHGYWLS